MDISTKKENIFTTGENIIINNTYNLTENHQDKENMENKSKEIIEKNPLEELKLIKEKIKRENEKIDEIDMKLDRIKQNKKLIKRDFNLNFNDELLKSLTTKNQNNKAYLKLKPILKEILT